MRQARNVVIAVILSAAVLWAGGCVKITRDQGGRTKVRPGTIEVTRHSPSADNEAGRYSYEGDNP